MAIYDGRLIDPSEKELTLALGKAMRSANTENKHQANKMTRDAAFWGRFALDVLKSGPEGRRRSCKGGRDVPEVITGWWTDPAGRKHVRIVGRTRQRYSRFRKETELRELPPWWHVYPEAVLGVRGAKEKEGEKYLAVCRCGAVGMPGSLGWMGDTCGPCFDRRADGGTPAGGFGQFGGWSPHLAKFAFTADGRDLIGQSRTQAFWKVNRDTGATVTAKKRSSSLIAATGVGANGIVLAMQEGSVFRWRADRDEPEQIIPSQQRWGRLAMPPDASRVTLLAYQRTAFANLTVEKPKYETIDSTESFFAFQYEPSGTRLIAANHSGEITALHPETLASTVLRRDAFDGLPSGYGPPSELVVAHDGASVLVRRDSYYHRGRTTVRHVPLPAGKVVEMRVPDWHKPTAIAYSPDARHAVTAEAESGWVGFWDVSNGKSLGFVRAVLEDTAWRSGQIEFSPDGSALAVSYNSGYGSHGSTIAVWPWPDVLAAAGV